MRVQRLENPATGLGQCLSGWVLIVNKGQVYSLVRVRLYQNWPALATLVSAGY